MKNRDSDTWGRAKEYIGRTLCVLNNFPCKLRAYGPEHLEGLEADSQFERNMAMAKAGILSALLSCQELEKKHLSACKNEGYLPYFSWVFECCQKLPDKVCSSTQKQWLWSTNHYLNENLNSSSFLSAGLRQSWIAVSAYKGLI